MELWVEHLEHGLANIVGLFKFALEAIAATVVFIGVIRTGQQVLFKRNKHHRSRILATPLSFVRVRLIFGMWLALALVFLLGADILATTIAPNFESLGELGAIALIRTFLNYFLHKELEAEYAIQEQAVDRPASKSPSIDTA
ncbi:MAG: DUF1622 domain-containing protein [Cyanobacteria bacterium J06633_2]